MWSFLKTYHNFFYEPWNFSKLDIGFNEILKVGNWVCIYGFGNVNVWKMFWVELNRRKRVFKLKCRFKWLHEISYVLAIELEVFEFKMMCYFAGTYFTWSKHGFSNWFETWIYGVSVFQNLSKKGLFVNKDDCMLSLLF